LIASSATRDLKSAEYRFRIIFLICSHRTDTREEVITLSEFPGPPQHANTAELLMVLERPEIPLHTNGSENYVRCQVTRRKISARTRSEVGRDNRDAFLSLTKTCDKLGTAVWDYLDNRHKVVGAAIIATLDHFVRARTGYASSVPDKTMARASACARPARDVA
jgi:hypothetical protein